MPVLIRNGKVIAKFKLDPEKMRASLRQLIKDNQEVFDALARGRKDV